MRKIPLRTLVLALTAIFLLFGGITAAMVFRQIVPDAAGGRRDEIPYQETFSLPLSQGDDLYLSLPGVNVVVIPYDGEDLLAAFDGTMPASWADREEKLIVRRAGSRVEITQEIKRAVRIQIGPTDTERLRGTLTVQTPRAFEWQAAALDTSSGGIDLRGLLVQNALSVNTFSGAAHLEGITAGRADIDLSSGDLTLSDCAFTSLAANAFSGKIELRDLVLAEASSLETSSGGILLERVTSPSLTVNTFSGGIQATDVVLEGGLKTGSSSLDTSSGDILLERVWAPSLVINTFSGSVQGSDVTLEGDFTASASSGRVTVRRLAARLAQVDTFSGAVTLEDLTAQSARAETSSGRISLALLQAAGIQCTTFSGDVELSLPDDMGFALHFDTFSGTFTSRLPSLAMSGGKSTDARTGDGAHSVNISTSSGNLTITPLE